MCSENLGGLGVLQIKTEKVHLKQFKNRNSYPQKNYGSLKEVPYLSE